jgi:hypothetical protein
VDKGGNDRQSEYLLPIARRPPPLLSSLPGQTQATIVLVVPLLAGAVCGFLLSETETGWWIGNAIAALGGLAGGYEHEHPRAGAARGALAGLMFGVGIVLADAVTAAAPIATTPEPLVLLPPITVIAGTALGTLGSRLRARAGTSHEPGQ